MRILPGAATAARRDGDLLEITVGDEVLRARTLLVATGLRDVLPAIDGLAERFGRDAIHCPFCHGYEVRDRPLAVLGGDNAAMSVHQALLIPQWSRDLVFFTNG
ncbi:NAD(P)/FAD-dependent oxidoreductase, partial [Tsukamurella paurometabola]|nr:NAD(P)/FAD-dependent oxidoreductase [Tsukamurella paurometabola]